MVGQAASLVGQLVRADPDGDHAGLILTASVRVDGHHHAAQLGLHAGRETVRVDQCRLPQCALHVLQQLPAQLLPAGAGAFVQGVQGVAELFGQVVRLRGGAAGQDGGRLVQDGAQVGARLRGGAHDVVGGVSLPQTQP